MLKKDNKGFSLVELLVVLAIVGILMALAVGGIRIVQQVNRDTQRKSLARDIQLALESYQEKENEYPDSISLNQQGGGCKGVQIVAGEEEVCSSVNFDVSHFEDGEGGAACEDSGSTTDDSGYFSGCYLGNSKSYSMFVELERTADNFNAGNALDTD